MREGTQPTRVFLLAASGLALVAAAACGSHSGADFESIPAAPTEISIHAIVGTAEIAWTEVAGADQYVVWLGTATTIDATHQTREVVAAHPPVRVGGLTRGPVRAAVAARKLSVRSGASPTVAAFVPGREIALQEEWAVETDLSANLGASLAWIPQDLDGDGRPELLVSAPRALTGTGEVLVFTTTNGTLSPDPVATLRGVASETFGELIVPAGDVNGDGRPDVMIVATHARDPNVGSGTQGSWQLFLGTAGTYLRGPAAIGYGATTGGESYPYLAVGDVDGNGATDVLAGNDAGVTYAGGVWGFFPGPLPTNGARVAAAPSFHSDLTTKDHTGVLAAQDVDGDQRAEVLLGTWGSDAVLPDAGLVELLRWDASQSNVVKTGLSLAGDVQGAGFGAMIVAAGDLDGDGVGDWLVGAPARPNGDAQQAGEICLVPGSVTTLETSWCAMGHVFNEQLGTSVAIGDFNGDSWPDLAVGAPGLRRVELFAGSPAGFDADPVAFLTVPATVGGSYPSAIAAIPDLDGNGVDELAVGAFASSRFYFYRGQTPPAASPVVVAGPSITARVGEDVRLSIPFVDATSASCELDWGDGTVPQSVAPCTPQSLAIATHAYSFAADFTIRVRANGTSGLFAESAARAHVEESP